MFVFKFLKAGGFAMLAFLMAATAVLLWFANLNTTSFTPNECAMTYYDGGLVDVAGAPDHPLYSLHEYLPSTPAPTFTPSPGTAAREEFILYVPGNAGDAFQSRSLASHVFDLVEETATNLKALSSGRDSAFSSTVAAVAAARALSAAPPALTRSGLWPVPTNESGFDHGVVLRSPLPSRVRVFALSFAEELTALSLSKASEQAAYTARVLAFLASPSGPAGPINSAAAATKKKHFLSPGIAVVGHSMGGVVALAASDTLLALPSASAAAGDVGVPHTVVTVGSPVAVPVVAGDDASATAVATASLASPAAASAAASASAGIQARADGSDGAGAGLYAAAARAIVSLPVITLGGSDRDEQISPSLASPPPATAAAAALAAAAGAAGSVTLAGGSGSVSGAMPVVPGADHKCLVWCRQYVKPLAATLLRRSLLAPQRNRSHEQGLGQGQGQGLGHGCGREDLGAAAAATGLAMPSPFTLPPAATNHSSSPSSFSSLSAPHPAAAAAAGASPLAAAAALWRRAFAVVAAATGADSGSGVVSSFTAPAPAAAVVHAALQRNETLVAVASTPFMTSFPSSSATAAAAAGGSASSGSPAAEPEELSSGGVYSVIVAAPIPLSSLRLCRLRPPAAAVAAAAAAGGAAAAEEGARACVAIAGAARETLPPPRAPLWVRGVNSADATPGRPSPVGLPHARDKPPSSSGSMTAASTAAAGAAANAVSAAAGGATAPTVLSAPASAIAAAAAALPGGCAGGPYPSKGGCMLEVVAPVESAAALVRAQEVIARVTTAMATAATSPAVTAAAADGADAADAAVAAEDKETVEPAFVWGHWLHTSLSHSKGVHSDVSQAKGDNAKGAALSVGDVQSKGASKGARGAAGSVVVSSSAATVGADVALFLVPGDASRSPTAAAAAAPAAAEAAVSAAVAARLRLEGLPVPLAGLVAVEAAGTDSSNSSGSGSGVGKGLLAFGWDNVISQTPQATTASNGGHRFKQSSSATVAAAQGLWVPQPVPVPALASCPLSSSSSSPRSSGSGGGSSMCTKGLDWVLPRSDVDIPSFVTHTIRAAGRAAHAKATTAAAATAAAAAAAAPASVPADNGVSAGGRHVWGFTGAEDVTVDVFPVTAARRLTLSPLNTPLIPTPPPPPTSPPAAATDGSAEDDVAAAAAVSSPTSAAVSVRVTLIPAPIPSKGASLTSKGGVPVSAGSVASLAAVPLPWTTLAKSLWAAAPGALPLAALVLLLRPAAAAVMGSSTSSTSARAPSRGAVGGILSLSVKAALVAAVLAVATLLTGLAAERPDAFSGPVSALAALWVRPLQCAYWGDRLAPQLCPQSPDPQSPGTRTLPPTDVGRAEGYRTVEAEARKVSPTGWPLLTVTPQGAPVLVEALLKHTGTSGAPQPQGHSTNSSSSSSSSSSSGSIVSVCPSWPCTFARALAGAAVWADAHTAPLAATGTALLALALAATVIAAWALISTATAFIAYVVLALPAALVRAAAATKLGGSLVKLVAAPALALTAAAALLVAAVNVHRSGALGAIGSTVKTASGTLLAAFAASQTSGESVANVASKTSLLQRVIVSAATTLTHHWDSAQEALQSAAAASPAPWGPVLTETLAGGTSSPALFPLPLLPVTPVTLLLLLALVACVSSALATALRPSGRHGPTSASSTPRLLRSKKGGFCGQKSRWTSQSRWGSALAFFCALTLLPALTPVPHSAQRWATDAAAAAPVAAVAAAPEEPAEGVDGWLRTSPVASALMNDARARLINHPLTSSFQPTASASSAAVAAAAAASGLQKPLLPEHGAWSLPAAAISLLSSSSSFATGASKYAAAARARAGLPPLPPSSPSPTSLADIVLVTALPLATAGDTSAPRSQPRGSVFAATAATALLLALGLLRLRKALLSAASKEGEIECKGDQSLLSEAVGVSVPVSGSGSINSPENPEQQQPQQSQQHPQQQQSQQQQPQRQERELFARRPPNSIPPLRLSRSEAAAAAKAKAEAEAAAAAAAAKAAAEAEAAKAKAEASGSESSNSADHAEDDDDESSSRKRALSPTTSRIFAALRVALLMLTRLVVTRRLFASRAAAASVGGALQRLALACPSRGAGACAGGALGVVAAAGGAVVEVTTGGASALGWGAEALVVIMAGVAVDAVEAVLTESF